MVAIPWILLLTKGAAIVEGPITDNIVIESLVSYHPMAEDWDNLMDYNNIVGSIHLDKR